MKKIFWLAILSILAYGGYRYTRAYLDFVELAGRMDPIISEPQSYSPASMRKFILEEAAKLQIPLSAEDIEISIGETDRESLGETLLERPGISVESKRLEIHFKYPVEILGFTRTFSYDLEKRFTSRASLEVPHMEEIAE